jgi:hypothetical protein
VFVSRDRLAAFWRAHAELEVVLHNAAFDLAVVQQVLPDTDVYERVDRDSVWDTRLLYQLHTLATVGHTAGGKGESTLEACARLYLGIELPKNATAADGREVRTDFGRFLNQPLVEIPPEYLRYLAADAAATFAVYGELRRRIDAVLAGSRDTWGYVSDDWLAGCVRRWGPLTHHLQVKASVVLAEITRAGLHVDPAARDVLVKELEADRHRAADRLRDHGLLVKGKGSQKALQAKLRELARAGVPVPTTPSGAYACDAETLAELAAHAPFAADLLDHRAADKRLGSFAGKLHRPVVRPSFGVLARTGRTTSFGELNAQNLPRDDRVRRCFVPSPGRVFLDLDYTAIELAALAQATLTQFRFGPAMADRINAGDDLHRVFAAHVLNKPAGEVTKGERDRVKAINFGKPGGMGDASLRKYAKASYGIDLSETEVKELAERWLCLFPEMRQYLTDEGDTPLALAARLGMTPAAHLDTTGDGRFARHPEARGRGHLPNAILGAMCLKVLGTPDPRTNRGEPYRPADIAFFWERTTALAGELSGRLAAAVRDRRPSPELRRGVAGLVGRAGVYTLTGRLRAAAGFTARRKHGVPGADQRRGQAGPVAGVAGRLPGGQLRARPAACRGAGRERPDRARRSDPRPDGGGHAGGAAGRAGGGGVRRHRPLGEGGEGDVRPRRAVGGEPGGRRVSRWEGWRQVWSRGRPVREMSTPASPLRPRGRWGCFKLFRGLSDGDGQAGCGRPARPAVCGSPAGRRPPLRDG